MNTSPTSPKTDIADKLIDPLQDFLHSLFGRAIEIYRKKSGNRSHGPIQISGKDLSERAIHEAPHASQKTEPLSLMKSAEFQHLPVPTQKNILLIIQYLKDFVDSHEFQHLPMSAQKNILSIFGAYPQFIPILLAFIKSPTVKNLSMALQNDILVMFGKDFKNASLLILFTNSDEFKRLYKWTKCKIIRTSTRGQDLHLTEFLIYSTKKDEFYHASLIAQKNTLKELEWCFLPQEFPFSTLGIVTNFTFKELKESFILKDSKEDLFLKELEEDFVLKDVTSSVYFKGSPKTIKGLIGFTNSDAYQLLSKSNRDNMLLIFAKNFPDYQLKRMIDFINNDKFKHLPESVQNNILTKFKEDDINLFPHTPNQCSRYAESLMAFISSDSFSAAEEQVKSAIFDTIDRNPTIECVNTQRIRLDPTFAMQIMGRCFNIRFSDEQDCLDVVNIMTWHPNLFPLKTVTIPNTRKTTKVLDNEGKNAHFNLLYAQLMLDFFKGYRDSGKFFFNLNNFLHDPQRKNWDVMNVGNVEVTDDEWNNLRGQLTHIIQNLSYGDQENAIIAYTQSFLVRVMDSADIVDDLSKQLIRQRVNAIILFLLQLQQESSNLEKIQKEKNRERAKKVVDIFADGGTACEDRVMVMLREAENYIKRQPGSGPYNLGYTVHVLVNVFKERCIRAKLVKMNDPQSVHTTLYYMQEFNEPLGLGLQITEHKYPAVGDYSLDMKEAIRLLGSAFTPDRLIGYLSIQDEIIDPITQIWDPNQKEYRTCDAIRSKALEKYSRINAITDEEAFKQMNSNDIEAITGFFGKDVETLKEALEGEGEEALRTSWFKRCKDRVQHNFVKDKVKELLVKEDFLVEGRPDQSIFRMRKGYSRAIAPRASPNLSITHSGTIIRGH